MIHFTNSLKKMFFTSFNFCKTKSLHYFIPSFFNRNRNIVTVLLIIMVEMFSIVGSVNAQLPAPAVFDENTELPNWDDTDFYWNASFNLSDGTVTINILPFEQWDLYHTQLIQSGEIYYYTVENGIEREHKIGTFQGDMNTTVVNYFAESGTPWITNSAIKFGYQGASGFLTLKYQINDGNNNPKYTITRIKFHNHSHNHYKKASDRYPDYIGERKISYTQMSPTRINNPAYQFLSNGSINIAYSKQKLTGVDSVSFLTLLDESQKQLKILGPVFPISGYVNVPFAASGKTYHYVQYAYPNNFSYYYGYNTGEYINMNLTLNSDSLTIPAFALPTSVSAIYDTTTQKVKLEWTIPPVTDPNRVNDKFKIQYATQADFSDATNLSFAYDATQANYSISLKDNLAQQLYFRVARDHEGFGWELSQIDSLSINIDSIHTNTLKDSLQNNAAVLNWSSLQSASRMQAKKCS